MIAEFDGKENIDVDEFTRVMLHRCVGGLGAGVFYIQEVENAIN
jgi:hypothetical protein